MQKLLIITPHMSTGGCPQFVLKRIELLLDKYDIYCVEWTLLSSEYVVQRNKVNLLLGGKFLPIHGNGDLLLQFISNINPDIIFIEEISETFIDQKTLNGIFNQNRTWKIIESTHGSDDKSNIKRYLPDKFIFVSEWSKKMYSHFNVPTDVVEYPVDKKTFQNVNISQKLGFDTDYKHIINVGLFTPGKNQKYAFDIAREMINEKVKFHFVGNMAGNFELYWKPLLQNKPQNCQIWGEKDNVEEFLMGGDLFLFTSLFELNPLVIKEALCYNLPTFMFQLDTYCGKYNNIDTIHFLSGNIQQDVEKIKLQLSL